MESTQAVLGRPIRVGKLKLSNRLVRSATYENMAAPDGSVGDEILRLYERLGRGGAALVITGHAFVHPAGKAAAKQIGAHDDAMIPGLRRLARAIRDGGALAALEIAHAGSQTTPRVSHARTIAPSARFQPVFASRARAMTEAEVREAVAAFARAAARAREAGFDAVQIHGAHGYLVNQFLSPRDNRRHDGWGGSEEARFAFLGDVVASIRREAGKDYPILLKLNGSDGVPGGLKPAEAASHARRAAEAGIEAIEVSQGTIGLSIFAMARGGIPADAFADFLPRPLRGLARFAQPWANLYGRRYRLSEAYGRGLARAIKPGLGVPLILVGGMRTPAGMAELVGSGDADLVSLARPLIHEPSFAARVLSGDDRAAACISCNRCLAAVADPKKPLRCYVSA